MPTIENSEFAEPPAAANNGAEDSGTLVVPTPPNGTQDSGTPPLPTLRTLGRPASFVPTAEPTLGQLAEMIAAQQRLLAKIRPCTGSECAEVVASQRTLQLLLDEFRRRSLELRQQSLESARKENRRHRADVMKFEVPRSHRAYVGQAITGLKRMLIGTLRPLHAEMLRPQYFFNVALVRVVEELVAGIVSGQSDPAAYLRRSLEPLADPMTWRVTSHRRGEVAAAIIAGKKGYLTAATPLFGELLAVQHRWNLAAIEALVGISSAPDLRKPELAELVRRMRPLCDPFVQVRLGTGGRLLQPLWQEVLRRQIKFNHETTDDFEKLLSQPRPGVDYAAWCAEREPDQISSSAKTAARIKRKPLISIITPAFNTPDALLRDCIHSVLKQSYQNWELCVVDDGSAAANVAATLAQYAECEPRIKFARLAKNSGIAAATNAAFAMTQGEYVAFLDHDDLLAEHALSEVALSLEAEPAADLIYSDEDRVDPQGRRSSPFCKPDWSPDLLRSVNYLCHLVVARRALVDAVGGVHQGYEGAQDYDLVLRLSEQAQRILHIPKILYHWRLWKDSLSQNDSKLSAASEAGCRALIEHLQRCGQPANVTHDLTSYRVRYPVIGKPLVSIIVPFKDKPKLLARLVDGLLKGTAYQNFELILISNNSVEPETHALLEQLTDARIRKLFWDKPFNYAAINNFGASRAKGNLLLFLNNDIEVVDPDWLDELIGHGERTEVGAVGAKLLFPDGAIQHAGVVLGIGGFAGHPFAKLPESAWTAFGSPQWTRNCLAVTAACLMIRREMFDDIQGFDEQFILCGNDVDLGLRLVERGKRIVYTPHAKLIHHESGTRSTNPIPANDYWMSFLSYRKWLRQGDPYYNPNLSLTDAQCGLREDERNGETLAVQFLSELAETENPVSLSRAAQQRHTADHLTGLDHTSVVAWELRRDGPEKIASLRKKNRLQQITWLVPSFQHPYGGIHTILRFGHQWRQRHDVKSTFLVYDNPQTSVADLELRAESIYPDLRGSFRVLRSRAELAELPKCDLAIATFWSSAYVVIGYRAAFARAYFVQDFEPLFYPAGTYYALAEQTYNLGLYGLFNSQGLHDFITGHYPMNGCWFEPTVDPAVFHNRRPEREGPIRIFFYGRPATDRNAFELGISVLRRLKQELGLAVEIISAGEAWSPEHYGLLGMVRNLGVLPYETTADLYRSCDIGLSFMFTKHPSYLPLELMACGVAVVANDNPANKWLFEHERNCLLAEPTSSCILEQLRRVTTDTALRQHLSVAGARRAGKTTWEQQIEKIYQALTQMEPVVSARRIIERVTLERDQRP
jgi:GT2 family glycosyltransferase/glycosyltransferase involved in cell wall biosynthesis